MRMPATSGVAFAAAFAGALGLVATAEAGLVVKQRSNGVPGHAQAELVPQILYVGERAIRLGERAEDGRYTIVRLDMEKVYEVDPARGEYTEQDFDYFRRQRAKAEQDREDALRKILDPKRFTPEERDRRLADLHLRADGKRIVTARASPGEVIQGWNTRLYEIFVNGERVVAVYATEDIREYEPPKVVFEFWEKAGLFDPEVVAQLKEIRGFPIRIYAKLVDLPDVEAEIRSEVEKGGIAEWTEEPSKFEIPKQFVKVRALAKPEDVTAQASRAELRCALCGKAVDHRTAFPAPGESGVFLCSEEHAREYIMKKRGR